VKAAPLNYSETGENMTDNVKRMIGHNRPIESALKEAKADLKIKSKQLCHMFETLDSCIKEYVEAIFYDNSDNYNGNQLKPEVKKEIKEFYERFNVSPPDEYLTSDELEEKAITWREEVMLHD
jgi:hypothetical protein